MRCGFRRRGRQPRDVRDQRHGYHCDYLSLARRSIGHARRDEPYLVNLTLFTSVLGVGNYGVVVMS